jgi:hypothetical protein
MIMNRGIRLVAGALLLWGMASPRVGTAQQELPDYLRDRGEGIATSMFGTYIKRGELLVYPFYEYVRDRNAEYEPADFGFGLPVEFRGDFWSHEALIFLGLGVTDWLAFEFEAAVYTEAQITKAENDTSAMPSELRESGLGDVQTQIRWRYAKETERRPEFFSYFETVFPLQKDKVLIGTSDWELALGVGAIKGTRIGTWTIRTTVGYDAAERKVEFGEYALEHLKRWSKLFRSTVLIEGEEDEVDLILDAQFHLSPRVFVRLNTGIGLTSKAEDIAPEVGVLFSFPVF